MKKSQKITLGVLAFFVCLLSLGIFYEGVEVYRSWVDKPLGPVLDYPTPGSFPPTWTAFPATPFATETLAPTMEFFTDTPAAPYSSCANFPTMIILGIGSDERSGEYRYGRADVIRAIRVDFGLQKVTVLAFPRDLWVEIPEIEDELGTNKQKLNTAYFFGNPGLHYWDHPSEGPGLLALTLDRNFGLTSDNYIAVSMKVFVDVVDAVDGLDVYLEEEVDGRYSYDQSERLYFPAGEQHLNGDQALTLARTRNKSTFARMDHQNFVLCNLQKKMRSPEVIPKIPAIITSFQDNTQTDLTPMQISQLACLATQMPMSNITFSSFPQDTFESSSVYDPVQDANTFVWDSDYAQIREYVERFEQGTWPVPVASSPSSSGSESGTSGCE